MADSKNVQVEISALIEDQFSGNPIVILLDRSGNRLIPIWIGDPEARAIAIAINKSRISRPLTHRLLLNTVEAMGGQLLHVIIDRLKNHTYYASIYIKKDKKEVAVDARPSDALALALEVGAPIFVDEKIMEVAGQENPFPGLTVRQEKREFEKEDLEKLKELLKKAREREEKSI